ARREARLELLRLVLRPQDRPAVEPPLHRPALRSRVWLVRRQADPVLALLPVVPRARARALAAGADRPALHQVRAARAARVLAALPVVRRRPERARTPPMSPPPDEPASVAARTMADHEYDLAAREGLIAGVLEPRAVQLEGPFGTVLAHAEPAPDRGPHDACQDAAAVIPLAQGLVLAVADGVGGTRGGAEAAQLALDVLYRALAVVADDDEPAVRGAILDAFEHADAAAQATPAVGSTTLLVVEIQRGVLRTYNTGDSEALIVGGRGKLKLRTVAHSPVGYQVAAGVLDPAEALHHDMRHYITHVVGDGNMRIDVGPSYA